VLYNGEFTGRLNQQGQFDTCFLKVEARGKYGMGMKIISIVLRYWVLCMCISVSPYNIDSLYANIQDISAILTIFIIIDPTIIIITTA
jgi:hypothetical protein